MKNNLRRLIFIIGVFILSFGFIGCESKEEKDNINASYEAIDEREYDRALEIISDTLEINEKNKRAFEQKDIIEKYLDAENEYSKFNFDKIVKLLNNIEFEDEKLSKTIIADDIEELKNKAKYLCEKKEFLTEAINKIKKIESDDLVINSWENGVQWMLKDYGDSPRKYAIIRVSIDLTEYPIIEIADCGVKYHEGAEEIFNEVVNILELEDDYISWFNMEDRPHYPMLDEYEDKNMYASIVLTELGKSSKLKFYGDIEECKSINEKNRMEYYTAQNESTISSIESFIDIENYQLALDYFDNLNEIYLSDEQKSIVDKYRDICYQEIERLEEIMRQEEEARRKEEEERQQAALNNGELTEEEALTLVYDYIKLNALVNEQAIKDNGGNLSFMSEERISDNMTGYHIKVGESYTDRFSTIAWYFVDKVTGDVYLEEFTGERKLVVKGS